VINAVAFPKLQDAAALAMSALLDLNLAQGFLFYKPMRSLLQVLWAVLLVGALMG
jgi:hypothetical protein